MEGTDPRRQLPPSLARTPPSDSSGLGVPSGKGRGPALRRQRKTPALHFMVTHGLAGSRRPYLWGEVLGHDFLPLLSQFLIWCDFVFCLKQKEKKNKTRSRASYS